MFMCVVNLKSVNNLTWKQSFLILVDSELFGRRSLYQLIDFSEETTKNQNATQHSNTVNISTKK
jgi:hypothetical protein